jgi:hypothetical protein
MAKAAVSVFALSTFETDYVLVRVRDLDRAVTALQVGFEVHKERENGSPPIDD